MFTCINLGANRTAIKFNGRVIAVVATANVPARIAQIRATLPK